MCVNVNRYGVRPKTHIILYVNYAFLSQLECLLDSVVTELNEITEEKMSSTVFDITAELN